MSPGQVRRVRLFADRALMTRRLPLAGPRPSVVFSPLPPDVDLFSVRARGELGGRPLSIRGLTWSGGQGEAPPAQRRVPAGEPARLQRALARLERYSRLEVLELGRRWVEEPESLERCFAALDQLRARHAELSARILALGAAEERAPRAPEQAARSVEVFLDTPPGTGGPGWVELSYITRSARWTPSYEIHPLSPGTGRLRLTAVALVEQATGEAWEEAELSVSAQGPSAPAAVPELGTLVLSAYDPALERGQTPPPRRPELPEGAPPLEVAAPERVVVPSHDRPVRVELFTAELPFRARLEVSPGARAAARLVAEVDNTSGRPLPPGRLGVFSSGRYLGQGSLPLVRPKERFRVVLGLEPSVRVERHVLSGPERRTAGGVSVEYGEQLTLENLGSTPLEVLVRSRIPVAGSDDVQIKLLQVDRAFDFDKDSGLGGAVLSLPPGTRRELLLSVRLSAPRGHRLLPPGR